VIKKKKKKKKVETLSIAQMLQCTNKFTYKQKFPSGFPLFSKDKLSMIANLIIFGNTKIIFILTPETQTTGI
jgi:hypothetical protein